MNGVPHVGPEERTLGAQMKQVHQATGLMMQGLERLMDGQASLQVEYAGLALVFSICQWTGLRLIFT